MQTFKIITAAEAIKIQSMALNKLVCEPLEKINKIIRDTAKKGGNSCDVSFKDENPEGLILAIKNLLVSQGFEVIFDRPLYKDRTLSIYWRK